MPIGEEEALESFLRISEIFTGFDRNTMESTGLARDYFGELTRICGKCNRDKFFDYANDHCPQKVLNSKFKELARNLIRMWYFGQWNALPSDLVEEAKLNVTRPLSAEAFRSGLGWDAIGTNPPGAKNPGFKSWSFKPRSYR